MRYLKFNMLENALDSLRQGLGFALKDNPSNSELKLSILLIVQAVELMLKERLKQEHWSLIFNKIEQAGDPKAYTVTIEDAIKRLEKIAHVQLKPEERETIIKLSEIRNRIQHYEIDITFEEVVGQAYAAIATITRFLKDELNRDIRDLLNEDDILNLLSIEQGLEHLQEMANRNIEKLQKEYEPLRYQDRMAGQLEVDFCPRCWQEFYVFSPGSRISQCQLCKYDGGFIECSHCGNVSYRGSMDFHYEHEDYSLCNSCWSDIEKD